MKKIAIITATRAEYGLLSPLICKVEEDDSLILDLIVTGTHLSYKYGYTLNEILKDQVTVTHLIPILEEGNTSYDVSITMANALKGFAACFRDDRPDMVVILGDRTEMLGVASAAMNERIPIAHIHGGEITEGAVDDCIRHALTKMSYIHFTVADSYRRRVIQLGEQPERVFNVGSLAAENIFNAPLLSESEIRRYMGVSEHMPYVVVTFHPVTLEDSSAEKQVIELCNAMKKRKQYFYLITKANADVGSEAVNSIMGGFAANTINVKMVDSLGMVRYLSALKYASFVMGNSSSGIFEAPVLGTPTINIGDRQKGRLSPETVINCIAEQDEIMSAMDRVVQIPNISAGMFGNGDTSSRIIKIIKHFLYDEEINMKKQFFDIGGIE